MTTNLSNQKTAAGEQSAPVTSKMTVHERINELLDPQSFREIGQFAGGSVKNGFKGAAVVTGYGTISGRKVAVYAQNFAVRGGTLGRAEGDKIIKLMDLALNMKIPVISLIDSGGARIQDGVVALSQYARIFRKNCEASGVIPQISLILGPCAGGAVYSPALTDFIIMPRDNSHMFVTGPDVVKAVTGEEVSLNELGGGELHNIKSGVAHYLADSEADAIEYTRTLLSYLPSNCNEATPKYAYLPPTQQFTADSAIAAIVPDSANQPYDIIEVIESLVDHNEFLEVQELFARNIVIGFACFEGNPVGIVANQPMHDAGTLDVDAAEKASRFVRFCDAFSIPIVTLVDVPGYRPGTEQEQAGIIRRGAKMIHAYGNATTPLITVVLRKAYGGAYIVMGSKALGADFNFAWPKAEIAVMGAEGAVSIMHRRKLAAAEKKGEDVDKLRKELTEQYTEETINIDLSVAEGEFDAVITPAQTRQSIIDSLQITQTKNSNFAGLKRHDNGPL
ncbi:MAG: acyl-CoA carboxylase subunit beta [Micrococcaceae bacterium]